MGTDAEAIRLLRHIRACLVVIACSCVFGMLRVMFPEYGGAVDAVGALFVLGVVIEVMLAAAGTFRKAASER